MQAVPYLFFKGDCKEAFEFYAEVLGGKVAAMITHGETPAAEHVPTEIHDSIIHARLEFDGGVLMASDCPPDQYNAPQGFYVSVHPETTAEAERLFNALAEGGSVCMPLEETFWAARFAMLTDRFGTPWMINCEKSA